MIDSSVNLVVKDLFLKFRVFALGGAKPDSVVLVSFYIPMLLFKLCLIRLENFIDCGDRCCPPGVLCGADKKCQAPGLCLSGCCGVRDCILPRECKASAARIPSSLRHRTLADSQCQCPYECCGDGDCTIDGEFCDGLTHQCTNESHVSTYYLALSHVMYIFDPIKALLCVLGY